MHGEKIDIVLLLTIGFALAALLGYIAQRCKLSPLLGYLLAGFLIGPYTPLFVGDLLVAEQLAEIGVILMMFGVGLHFKLEDLVNVKGIAIPGAIGQTLVATICGALFVYSMGWSIESGVVLGVGIGVASTVVLIRVLTDNHLLKTPQGHVAIGWLIVEDILTVFVILLLPSLVPSENGFSWTALMISVGIALFKFAILTVLMLTIGKKVVTYCMFQVARTRSHELFTLAIMALTFIIATGSMLLFGASLALGAFIAGMIIGLTHLREQAFINSLPLKDIFAVIFFLAVGMLFNPHAILENWFLFLGVLAIILLIKPIAAYVIVVLLKHPIKTAVTVALALAQIGEFSFILAEEATRLNILPDQGYDVIVACAIVSIALNPLLFKTAAPLKQFFRDKSSSTAEHKSQKPLLNSLQNAIVIGYGPVGQNAAEALKTLGFTPIVVDRNVDTISKLIHENQHAFYGDAINPSILEVAQIKTAGMLVVTVPDSDITLKIVKAARQLNPKLKILARARFTADVKSLRELGAETICGEEEEVKEFKTRLISFTEKLLLKNKIV